MRVKENGIAIGLYYPNMTQSVKQQLNETLNLVSKIVNESSLLRVKLIKLNENVAKQSTMQ